MSDLMILRGVPASGKTTFAQDRVEVYGAVRVSRDDLRFGMFGQYWGVDEEAVSAAEESMLRFYLGKGENVVLDSTNLNRRFLLQKLNLARELGASVRYRNFPISLADAIERDRVRILDGGRGVGEEVIRDFFRRYSLPQDTGTLPAPPDPLPNYVPYVKPRGDKPQALIVDTDGTVALMNGRGPYDTYAYSTDLPNLGVIQVVRAMEASDVQIIGVSGRDSQFRDVTLKWWEEHVGMRPDLFLMRPEGDTRNDALVKYELFDEFIRNDFDVVAVLDDRPRVLRMWRAINIPTLQVGNGTEF